jgi:hypothetical protein
MNHQVDGRQRRQKFNSYDFSKTPFQLVAVDGGVAVSRHHDADSRMPERGNEISEVEMPAPNSLPPSNDGFQVGLPGQPKLSRKPGAVVRRPRTYSAVSR